MTSGLPDHDAAHSKRGLPARLAAERDPADVARCLGERAAAPSGTVKLTDRETAVESSGH
jgi:hypothetical protein